jgi:hypothetical protein
LFYFSSGEEKCLGQFTKNNRIFYPNYVSSQKYGFRIRDPGSGKILFVILDPKVKGTGSRMRIPNNVRKRKPFLEIFCPVLETSAAALSMFVATNKTLAFEKFVKT